MYGSGAQGKWMVSSVTEGHIKKLRRAGYLPDDIAHRLLDERQLIPTPRPHERAVFLPHFLRGLGFPLHPFVRGLMFYYGLVFHDLAPNFILNIARNVQYGGGGKTMQLETVELQEPAEEWVDWKPDSS